MKCEACGASIAVKQENGTIRFECNGYRYTNGASCCPVAIGPTNKDRVMKEYRELRGIQLDHSEHLENLKKSESLAGRKHTEMNKDGSVGAWHRRSNPRPKPKSWKL